MSKSKDFTLGTHDGIEVFAAVQNGVILDIFDNYDAAENRIKEEQQRDFLSIVFRRKLRKLFKKSGNVALHRYNVIGIHYMEEIK